VRSARTIAQEPADAFDISSRAWFLSGPGMPVSYCLNTPTSLIIRRSGDAFITSAVLNAPITRSGSLSES
jgi:hypothetical protein